MKYTKNRSNHAGRLRFYKRQLGLCWLCGEHIDMFQPTHTAGSASWEHIIPASSGGSDRMTNMALTHYECNKLRGDRFIFRVDRPRCRPYAMPTEKYLRVGFEITLRKLRRVLAPRRHPAAAAVE